MSKYSHLTDAELKEMISLEQRSLLIKNAKDKMLDYCQIMMPDIEDPDDVNKTEYQRAGHAKMLCDIVERFESGKSKRVAVSIPPQHGKPCLETDIVLMGDGSRKQLKDVQVNDYVITKYGRPREVKAVHKQGELECVTLKTKSGRKVTAALDHPMLTPGGWVNAGDIKIGMSLINVVPDTFSDNLKPTEYELCAARLAGYFVGDGACGEYDNGRGYTSTSSIITVVDDVEFEDIKYCCRVLGFEYSINDGGKKARSVNIKSGVKEWLRRIGLSGKTSHNKRVPDFVFNSHKDVIAHFLGAYFACDGTINKKGKDRHGKQRKDVCVEYYSVSEGLIDDTQHLLMRIGIQSTKGVKRGKYKGGVHLSWRLSLTSQDYVARFVNHVPVFHNKSKISPTWDLYRTQPDNIHIVDPVVEIINNIYGSCRCLSVDEDKSFVINDFVVHNTIHLSQIGLSWIWGKNPRKNILVVTYNQTRADELGHEFRQMIRDKPTFRQVFPEVEFQADAKSKSFMQNKAGGKIFFIGVGGTITGRTADYIIIDDPFKGDDDEFTEGHLERIWSWFYKVAYSRASNRTKICVIHTRWNEDDLVGRLCDPTHPERNKRFKGIADDWEFMNIPGVIRDEKLAKALGLKLSVPTDPKVIQQFGSDPCTALWPGEKSLEFFAQWKRGDPRSFSALVMGSPTPDDGIYFTQEMINTYSANELPLNLRIYGASDHAVSEKQQRDKTVIGCVGIDENDDIWVLPDLVWDQMQTDRTVEELISKMKMHSPAVWWMESEMISKSFGPFLRKRMVETNTYTLIDPVTPTKDKMTRARSIQGRMSMRKVRFPSFAPWFMDAKNQMMRFPHGANDDFVDWIAWIGLGLTKELAAQSYRKPKNNIPETGTAAWVIHSSEQRKQAEKLRNSSRGW